MKARAEEYRQDSLYSFQFSINSSGKSIETMKIYAKNIPIRDRASPSIEDLLEFVVLLLFINY